jgi:hypothetical protein
MKTPNFDIMNLKSHTKKVAAAIILVSCVQLAFASFTFTGNVGDKNGTNKYTLRNLSRLPSRTLSLSSIRNNMQLRGTQIHSFHTSAGTVTVNSAVQYNHGNTTYIFPYKIKVKVPKFVTPTAPNR